MRQVYCMGAISVRLDDATERWIRDHGEKPGTFCRLAVMKEVRRREVEEAHAYLEQHRVRLPKSAVEMIREDRDHGHRPGHGF